MRNKQEEDYDSISFDREMEQDRWPIHDYDKDELIVDEEEHGKETTQDARNEDNTDEW